MRRALYAVILGYGAFYTYYRIMVTSCTCQNSLHWTTANVTGAITGIGYEIARELASRGARVILACRDTARGLSAQERIVAATGNQDILFRPLNLESFRSVRSFAFVIMMTEFHLDILVNNAGIVDGMVREAQVIHFGPFLLTRRAIDLMKFSQQSRIINVTACAHRDGRLNPTSFDKPARDNAQRMRMVGDTKLALVLFTKKLSKLVANNGVTVDRLWTLSEEVVGCRPRTYYFY